MYRLFKFELIKLRKDKGQPALFNVLLAAFSQISHCCYHSQKSHIKYKKLFWSFVFCLKHFLKCHPPAPRLSPAQLTPCRDPCAPSPCTAHKCTSGQCDRTAPDPSDAADRSAGPSGRFHPPACAS